MLPTGCDDQTPNAQNAPTCSDVLARCSPRRSPRSLAGTSRRPPSTPPLSVPPNRDRTAPRPHRSAPHRSVTAPLR